MLTCKSFLQVYNPDLLDSSDRNQKSSLKLRLALLKGRLSDIYNKTYRNNFFFLFLLVPENYKRRARQKHIEIHMLNISPWHKHTLRSNCLTYPLGISPYPHRETQPQAPQEHDKPVFLCQWSGSPMSHVGTGAAHLSATRHSSLDGPAVFSTPLAPEPT